MNTTTLRGIFPEPKPVHRKNFLKENVQQIKRMQGLTHDTKPQSQQQFQKLRNASQPMKPGLLPNKSKQELNKSVATKLPNKPKVFWPKTAGHNEIVQKLTHRSVQTETVDDLSKLYSSGVVKYPSPSLRKSSPKKTPLKKILDHGDQISNVNESLQKLGLEEKHDFIRANIKNIRKNLTKQDQASDPTQPPINYQKGVVPKYLKERKEEEEKSPGIDPDSYPGHILLPDNERKEYLRVSRESYADLIRELNAMPLKNDTLKMKKRKMDIEEELKKIEEAIKVFQKPKVFVKADM